MFHCVRRPFLYAILALALTLAVGPAHADDKPIPDERPAKPSDKRIEIATYHGSPRMGEPSILVQRKPDQDTWTRVVLDGAVFTADRLVSLPGFASEVRTKSGVHLLLWGTLPEFNQGSPVVPYLFESAVRLHDNPKFDLELTLDHGRIYLSNHKDKPALVRLRFGKEIWDLVLQERDTEIAVEFIKHNVENIKYLEGEEPVSVLSLFVAKGKASLKYDKATEIPNLEAAPGPALMVWGANKDHSTEGPFKIEADSPVVAFLGKTPHNADSAKALKDYRPGLDEVSKLLAEKKPVDALLLDGIKTGRFPNLKAVCIYSLGAVDAVPALLDILASEEEKAAPEREDAVMALRRWICHGPQMNKVLYDAKANEGLLLKKGYKPVEAATLVQLLYFQISESTAKRKDTYETLIGYLRHSKMAVRELAFHHLKQLTFGVKVLPAYDPSWSAEMRNKAATQWDALVKKGELPPPPMEPK